MLGLLLLSAEPDVTFSFHGAEGCPPDAAVRSEVEALLGRGLDTPFVRSVTVSAEVIRSSDRYVLAIEGRSPEGPFERTIEDPSCRALASAAALIVALAIDPSVTGEMAPPPPEPPDLESVPAPDPPPPLEISPLPFGIPWPRIGVFAGASYETGTRPGAGFEIDLGAAIFWRYFRVELQARYGFAESVRFNAQPSSGADVSLLTGGGRACPVIPIVLGLEVPLCLGVDLGILLADPVELANEAPGRGFFGAVVASAGVAHAVIDELAVRLEGEGQLAVFRPSYEVAPFGEIHRPSRFGLRGTLEIEVRLF
jgi:hypothetical protein